MEETHTHCSDSVPIIVALHGLAERPLVASTAWPSVSNHMSSGASSLRMPPKGKNPERDDGNLCFGCGARHGYSADWLEEDHFINWAHPTGRGNWCRSCHLLHKASFKEFPEKKDLRKWQLDSPHNIGVKDGFAHGMAKRAVLARRQAKGIIIEGCSRVRDDLAHGMAKCAVLASESCILTDYGNTYDLLGSEKKKQ